MDQSQKKQPRTYPWFWYIIPIGVALGLILYYSRPSTVSLFSNGNDVINLQTANSPVRSRPPHIEPPPPRNRCSGRYVYMHDLPSRFNSDLLRDCRTLNKWVNMCVATSNAGLGPRLGDFEGVFSDEGWYATDQFALEVIFHNRMKQYECLTTNSSQASAVFVPYYAGFDLSRYLWGHNASVRDFLSLDLFRWLKSRPEWAAMEGQDHFVVAGRTTWDFRNPKATDDSWGNRFLNLPETKNMTVLVIESSPWNRNDFGIPYPTYFHPSKDGEVFAWQERMKKMERPWLFTFAALTRKNKPKSIRTELFRQCRESQRCKPLDCDVHPKKCFTPSSVMSAFQNSVFCLQPPGDSSTRRSTFDSMVAGCVPVFFHPASAYVQYLWHLPKNFKKYSVFISEVDVREGKVNVEEVLSGFSEEQVRDMRDEVIRIIPRLVYADPRSRLEKLEDAVDVAVESVIERVEKLRANNLEGIPPVFEEANSWTYAMRQIEGDHDWDHFFSNPS